MATESGVDDARRAHFTYVWAIENGSSFSFSNKLLSPTFVVKAMEMTKWHLEAEVAHGVGHLTLSICKEPNGCSEMFEIDFEFTLFGLDDHLLGERCGTSRFKELGISRWGVTFHEQEFCEQFPKETLTIRCRMWRRGCEMLQYDLCFARTHVKVEKHSFVGAIKGFSSLRPRQNKIVLFHPTSESIPTLILTFCLQEKDGKEYGCVAVHRTKLMETLPMDVEVFLLNVEGGSVKSKKKEIWLWPLNDKRKVCELSEFFEREEITSNNAKFLVNDVLSLRCEFDVNVGPLWSRIENYRELEYSDAAAFTSSKDETHLDRSEFHVCPFKDILKTLYEDGTLSDISLTADSQYFSVHKNILGARSPVLKSMFTKDMEKCFTIPDLSAGTLPGLLLYIYTNRVEELPLEGAVDLFRAASKYKLMDLREMCSDILKAKISASNLCEMEELANKHQDEDLRKIVYQFKMEDLGIFDCNPSKKVKIAN